MSLYLKTRANLEKKRKPPNANSIGIISRFHSPTRFRKSTGLPIELRLFVSAQCSRRRREKADRVSVNLMGSSASLRRPQPFPVFHYHKVFPSASPLPRKD